MVAASDNMEASIMATLVCKEIGVPYVMAKAKNELHATVLKKIGAKILLFFRKRDGNACGKESDVCKLYGLDRALAGL